VVPLSPRAIVVLWHLVSQAEQLVSKTARLKVVWPETVVSEGVLTMCIRERRRVLDDEARQPRYIETMHRRGYRCRAELQLGRLGTEVQTLLATLS
jgi:DNA-binding winged helix-turn-helix (wHTH) protein